MSIGRRTDDMYRPRAAVAWLVTGFVLASLPSSDPSAHGKFQQIPIPAAPSRAESVPLRTVPATCGLPSEAMLRLEERFRSILGDWLDDRRAVGRLDADWQAGVDEAAGFAVTDVTVHRLPASPSGRVIVPAIGCHERAEQEILRPIVAWAPETIPAFFAFYLDLYRLQIAPPPSRRWLASRSRDRLLWLARQQRQGLRGSAAERARRGRMLLMLADVMQAAPFLTEILEGRDLLDEVIDLDSALVAARYLSATLAERTGDYEVAVRELERLARRLPDDGEVALRLAINRARNGDKRAAKRGLAALARTEAPVWIRTLAYQEWAALVAGERGTGERVILDEALSVVPDETQLSLQLAAAMVRAGEWGAAERVVGDLSPGDPDEPTARSLYDLPRRDELEREAVLFRAEVDTGVARLRSLLRADRAGRDRT